MRFVVEMLNETKHANLWLERLVSGRSSQLEWMPYQPDDFVYK